MKEEMDYKLKNGADALFEKLFKDGKNDVVNVNRKFARSLEWFQKYKQRQPRTKRS